MSVSGAALAVEFPAESFVSYARHGRNDDFGPFRVFAENWD